VIRHVSERFAPEARGDSEVVYSNRRVALPTLLAVLALAGCSLGDDARDAARTTTAADTATGTDTAVSGADLAPDVSFGAIPDLVEELQPSVVSIVLDGGEGSGVIVDEDTIVTNAHVVGDAATVEVVLASGRRVEASIEAIDERTDLALLSVRGEDLPGVRFAEELPRVGELAVALGNPLGFENTVTAGIISGLHRAVPSSGQTPALIDLLQTDAPISPGNSGGALVNARGEVIGINVAYIPPESRAVSIGFAIPAPTVTDVIEQLEENGRVRHAFLGILPGPLTPQVADEFGLEAETGVLVLSVTEGSPAAEAELEEGDVIVALDGEEIRVVEDLLSRLREREPGDRVTVEVLRGDDRRELEITLADRSDG